MLYNVYYFQGGVAMISFNIKKLFLHVNVVYFAEKEDKKIGCCDVVHYIYSSDSIQKAQEVHTLCIDLSKDESTLLKEMDRNARNYIKKSEAFDNFECSITFSPSSELLDKVRSFYNTFAKNKGIGQFENIVIEEIKRKNALAVSEVKSSDGNTLCYHVYIADGKTAYCKYSASHFRLSADKDFHILVGRANRYLHWTDIRFFKKNGYQVYDFAGLTLDKNNKVLNNIDRFKREFGGSVVTKYNFYIPKNLLGKFALKIFK
jgi:lipid II:glycine glycyltransferase (peptidoglycan interpeptide bridge formation enzyme)